MNNTQTSPGSLTGDTSSMGTCLSSHPRRGGNSAIQTNTASNPLLPPNTHSNRGKNRNISSNSSTSLSPLTLNTLTVYWKVTDTDDSALTSKATILRKRQEFWDTAPSYSGKEEIWQALKAAIECQDLELARAILSSVNVSLPNGDLTLVYDELGNQYEIPTYCLSFPQNVKDDCGDSEIATGSANKAKDKMKAKGKTKSINEQPAPAKFSSSSHITSLKCRLSLGIDVVLSDLSGSETISDIRDVLAAKQNISPAKIAFFLLGKGPIQETVQIGTLKGLSESNNLIQVMIR